MSEEPRYDSSLIGQRRQRIDKANKLRELGIDPYPAKANRTHSANDIIIKFTELEGTEVTVVGRVLSLRATWSVDFCRSF